MEPSYSKEPPSIFRAADIRKRPAMWIGGLNERGLHQVLFDLVHSLIFDLSDHVTSLTITIHKANELTIVLQGEVAPLSLKDLSTLNDPYLSAQIASAFCSWFEIEIHTANQAWRRRDRIGEPIELAENIPKVDRTGLTIRCQFDSELFKDLSLNFLKVCGRMQDIAIAKANLLIRILEEETGLRRDYIYPDGLISFGHESSFGSGPPTHMTYTEGPNTISCIVFEAAAPVLTTMTILNSERIIGGEHVRGFERALRRIWRLQNPERVKIDPDRPRLGKHVVFCLDLKEVEFYGPTKDFVGGITVRRMAYRMVMRHWRKFPDALHWS